MEERIVDDPRKIRVKKHADGGIADVEDALAPETEEDGEEELVFDMPEEGLDEDLVGLSPSQLEAELERRKKEAEEAERERDRILAAAEDLFQKGRYSSAEPLFAQAAEIDPTCMRALEALWRCRSENFTSTEGLLNETYAQEFADADETVRGMVSDALGARMRAEQAELEARAVPLRTRVREGQDSRREAFKNNRDYYRTRFFAFLALVLVFAAAAGISSAFIASTPGFAPVIVVIALAACAVLVLPAAIFFARKFFVAQRLCLDNEKLSSTEDGAKLEEIERRLALYRVYLAE